MDIQKRSMITPAMLIAVVALALARPALAQEAVAGDSPVSFGIRPTVASSMDPASFGYFVHTIVPGDVTYDEAALVNEGAVAVDLDLYVASATTAINGSTALGGRSSAGDDLASWISIETDRVHLEPGETSLVGFSVAVPPDATPGDHVAGLVVEPVSGVAGSSAAGEQPSGTSQFTVNVVRRVGAAVLVSVPGDRTPSLRATGISLDHHHDNGAVFSLTVDNDGNLMVDGSGVLEVADVQGGSLASFEFEMDTVLAGDAGLYYLDLPVRLSDGRYRLKATIDYRPVRGTETSRTTSVTNTNLVVEQGLAVVTDASGTEQDAPSSVRTIAAAIPVGSSEARVWLLEILGASAAVLLVYTVVLLALRPRRSER